MGTVVANAGVYLLRQGAKLGANYGLNPSIIRIDETFRCVSHLFSRNNKTAFQQVECRFAGNPLYQPGIWTPSKTPSRDEARRRGLYQPWIWTPSRTLRRSHPGPRGLYQPGIWTPSRTTSLNGYSVGKLYQPGIWTPSRAISLGHDPSRQLYQPGIWTPSRTCR